jgi:hypothetical protein
MRFTLAVIIPLLAQVLFVLVIIVATNGTGSFVGLGAMLLGLIAIPLTALVNWVRTRKSPPVPALTFTTNTLLIALAFPLVIVILYAVAS